MARQGESHPSEEDRAGPNSCAVWGLVDLRVLGAWRHFLTRPCRVGRLHKGAHGQTRSFICPFQRPRRLARPRTPPFHGDNTGSNPVGDANKTKKLAEITPNRRGPIWGPVKPPQRPQAPAGAPPVASSPRPFVAPSAWPASAPARTHPSLLSPNRGAATPAPL